MKPPTARPRRARDRHQAAHERVPLLVKRRVVVATDGSDASDAALRFARHMESLGDWEPETMTVLEPLPVSMAEVAFAAPSDDYVRAAQNGILDRIARQVKRHGNSAWKFSVEFGRTPSTIAAFAREHSAEVLVLGLGRHGKLARLFGADTAGRVARQAGIPVLAVDADARPPLRTALVAIDFGISSVRAAREALHLLEPPARLHLLHVRWAFEGRTLRPAEWEQTYASGVDVEFARLLELLGHHPGIRTTYEQRLGNVVKTTLAVASQIKADLIAAGSHNQNVVDRLLIGSTPHHLLQAASCSVLIASPGEGPNSARAGAR